jgi:hypothetical protein
MIPARTADWARGLRAAARDLAEDLRRSDRFSRMRVAVVAAWAAISLVTLIVACPSSGPGNSLGADVRVQGDGLLGGAQIMVRNDSDEVWTDVVLTLDGGWAYRQATLRPDDRIVVSTGQFAREGAAPPADYRPRTLEVDCRQGSHRLEVR